MSNPLSRAPVCEKNYSDNLSITHKFVEQLEKTISRYGLEYAKNFRDTMVQITSLNANYTSMIYGNTATSIMQAVQSTLMFMSEAENNDTIKEKIWNPVIALTIQTMIDLFRTTERTTVPGPSTITKQMGNMKVTSSKNKNTKSRSKQQASVASALTTRPVASENPVAVHNKASPHSTSKAKKAPTQFSSSPPVDVANAVASCLNVNFTFRNTSGIRCKTAGCSTCINFAKSHPLSKCSELKCHKRNIVCHPTGWYYHALPQAWQHLVRLHSNPTGTSNMLEEACYDDDTASTITSASTSSHHSKRESTGRWEDEVPRKRTITHTDYQPPY